MATATCLYESQKKPSEPFHDNINSKVSKYSRNKIFRLRFVVKFSLTKNAFVEVVQDFQKTFLLFTKHFTMSKIYVYGCKSTAKLINQPEKID